MGVVTLFIYFQTVSNKIYRRYITDKKTIYAQ